MPDRPAELPDEDELLTLLSVGELDVLGRISDASNATLYCTATLDGVTRGCVYKPTSGERPLWDFPHRTLSRREVSAYVLAAATGWRIVPPTVYRDGPFGPGSVQWWIDAGEGGAVDAPVPGEPGAGLIDVVPRSKVPPGWLAVLDADGGDGRQVALVHADDERLRRMALFDAVANNTDRKGGHVLRHAGGEVFGVDHGLTFSTDDKLRTVLWGWAGRPIAEEEREVLGRLCAELTDDDGPLRAELVGLLTPEEVDVTAERAGRLLRRGRFPRPPAGWPAIPWPAF